MPTITFASSKGGAGKTTSAIVLASTLAQEYSVLMIDADPAERLMSWSRKGELPENITVAKSQGERSIHDEIEQGLEDFDFVLIDLEGAATRLNAYAMTAADLVIVPMGDEQPDAEGTLETLAMLRVESRATRRNINTMILFCKTQSAVKSRMAMSINKQIRERIENTFTVELYQRTAYSSLHNMGGSLYDLDREAVTGVDKAILNAELLREEVYQVLENIAMKRMIAKEKSHA